MTPFEDINTRDDWSTWSKYVLKELERLNGNYERVIEKINDLHLYYPTKKSLDELEKKVSVQEEMIDNLRLVFAKWTGIAIVVFIIIQIGIGFLFNDKKVYGIKTTDKEVQRELLK